jgi:hypothetical protein
MGKRQGTIDSMPKNTLAEAKVLSIRTNAHVSKKLTKQKSEKSLKLDPVLIR